VKVHFSRQLVLTLAAAAVVGLAVAVVVVTAVVTAVVVAVVAAVPAAAAVAAVKAAATVADSDSDTAAEKNNPVMQCSQLFAAEIVLCMPEHSVGNHIQQQLSE